MRYRRRFTDRMRREMLGQCVYPGCPDRALDTCLQCEMHRDDACRRQREYAARKRGLAA